jgi:hypothetical protein
MMSSSNPSALSGEATEEAPLRSLCFVIVGERLAA